MFTQGLPSNYSCKYTVSILYQSMATTLEIIRGEVNYASRPINRMYDKEPQFKLAQKLAFEFFKILKT
ncbi:hypothetical protein CWO05_19895 [Vibrio splendidus]|nr:hypothetical protein CWO05_19895 [Vibrio splendidus]